MIAQSFPSLLIAQWQPIVVALIGGVAAGLTLYLGLIMVDRRRKQRPAAKPEFERPPDPFLHGSATEKRTSLRRRGNPVKVLLSNAEATSKPLEAWVLDRSMGGLCLQVDHESYPPGAILSVRTANAPQSTLWIQIEVKSVRQQDGGWELGCQFVKAPSWNVLLQFG